MMKAALIAIMSVMIMSTSGNAGDAGNGATSGNTTTVRNGGNFASVTQSGDPAQAEVHVETKPGYTKIFRRSGGNTTVVTQSTTGQIKPEDLPPWLKELLRRSRPPQ
jgi:hypothetical protein